MILDAAFSADRIQYYDMYLMIVALLVIMSLMLVHQGTRHIIASENSSAVSPFVGGASSTLLAVSILVGTTWHPLPGDTSSAATAWAITIFVIITLVALFAYGYFGFKLAKALIRFALVSAQASKRIATSEEFWQFLRLIATRFAQAILASIFIVLLWYSAIWILSWIISFAASDDDLLTKFFEAVFAFVQTAILYTVTIGLIGLAAIPLPYLARLVLATPRSVTKALHLFRITISNYANQFSKLRDRLPNKIGDVPIRHILGCGVRLAGKVCFAILRKIPLMLITLPFLTIDSSSILRTPSPEQPEVQAPPSPEPPKPPIEEVAPELEFLITTPVDLCAPNAGSIQWSYESVNVLELPLARCQLPVEVRENNEGLILFGLSSRGSNKATENERAYDRGLELARWASLQNDPDLPIYIVNLGMAQNQRALTNLRPLIGPVLTSRPAPVVALRAFPSEAIIQDDDVSAELEKYFDSKLERPRFLQCVLFRLERFPGAESELVVVKDFGCNR